MLKTREKFFEDSHTYRQQKNGAEKSTKFFFKILTNIGSKKIAGKNARKFFEDSHEYREQKYGGKKTREKFF